MGQDLLHLTDDDAANYVALCNMIHGVVVHKVRTRIKGELKKLPRPRDARLTKPKKLSLLHKQDFQCLDCGKDFDPSINYTDATIDHIIQYKFGSTLKNNVELVCYPCNRARGQNYSLDFVEARFGKIDMSMILPVVRLCEG